MVDLISVIVPVHNIEKYLTQCIESILSQSYLNLEIILVDDGSTDTSPQICDEYAEKDRRVSVYHRPNMGLSKTRQFGIDVATGAFFTTIDSDDYIDSTFIEKMYARIKETASNICVCGRYDFDTKGFSEKPLNLEFEEIQVTSEMLCSRFREIGKKLVLSDSWNKMYDTLFVRQSGVVFELDKRFNGNDLAFNYKLVLHCPKYCIVDQPLLFHRNLPGSLVHRKNKPLQEGFEEIVRQIYIESEKCGVQNKAQIDLVYFNLMTIVIEDFLKYSDSGYEVFTKVKKFFEQHKVFRERNTIQVNEKQAIDFYQRMFFRTLQRRTPCFLEIICLLVFYKRRVMDI